MVLSSGIAGGALAGAVVWLSKSWISERLKRSIQYEYDQKIETIKAQFSAENSISVEKLRADLRIEAHQRETLFATLHAKRAEVIGEMHALIQGVAVSISQYIRQRKEGRNARDFLRHLNQASEQFSAYFQKNKIYLPRDLDRLTLETYRECTELGRQVHKLTDQQIMQGLAEPLYENFQNVNRQNFEVLKTRFRAILGDDPPDAIQPPADDEISEPDQQ